MYKNLSKIVKSSRNFNFINTFSIALIISFSFSFILLKEQNFHYVFGDEHKLYFPAFVKFLGSFDLGSFLTKTDLSTWGGSTDFWAKPNIAQYSPFWILSGIVTLFRKNTYDTLLFAYRLSVLFALIIASGGFFYFSKNILRLNNLTSILGSIIYTGTIFSWQNFEIPVFLYTGCWGPLLCISFHQIINIKKINFFRIFFYSSPISFCLFSGYLPLGIVLVITSLLTILYINKPPINEKTLKIFYYLIVVNIPILFWLIGMYDAYQNFTISSAKLDTTQTVNFGSKSINQSICYFLSDLDCQKLNLWQPIEGNHVNFSITSLGIILVPFLINLGRFKNLEIKKDSNIQSQAKNISLFLIILFFLIGFGERSGLLSFLRAIPAIGKMHVPGRYMIIGALPFSLLATLSFQDLFFIIKNDIKLRQKLLIISIGLFIFSLIISISIKGTLGNNELLSADIFFLSLTLFGLSFLFWEKKFSLISSLIILISILSAHTSKTNQWIFRYGNSNPSPLKTQNIIPSNPFELARLRSWLEETSIKNDLKIIYDLRTLDNISQKGDITPNLSWLLNYLNKQDNKKTWYASLHGYEQHLGTNAEYASKKLGWWGVKIPNPNDLLCQTQPDYIVIDRTSTEAEIQLEEIGLLNTAEISRKYIFTNGEIIELKKSSINQKLCSKDISQIFQNYSVGRYLIETKNQNSIVKFDINNDKLNAKNLNDIKLNVDGEIRIKDRLFPSNMGYESNDLQCTIQEEFGNKNLVCNGKGNISIKQYSENLSSSQMARLFSTIIYFLFISSLIFLILNNKYSKKI